MLSLGHQNISAVAHVRHFIKANETIFRSILHPPTHESLTMAGLEELSLATGVLAKCGPLEEADDSGGNGNGLFQLRQQMISLIHHFDSSEHLLKKGSTTLYYTNLYLTFIRMQYNIHQSPPPPIKYHDGDFTPL